MLQSKYRKVGLNPISVTLPPVKLILQEIMNHINLKNIPLNAAEGILLI